MADIKNRTQKTDTNEKNKEQRIHDAYSEMGKKGGETRKDQLGHDGYVEMGKMGGEARKEQMAEGKITKDQTNK